MTAAFVVIVNYRTAALVEQCLFSLLPELPALSGGRVIVVDNASGDDSCARIAATIRSRGWQEWAEVVALPRNGGFAYGNNRAIERVRAHDPGFGKVVFLNPDTLICPGAIQALLAQLDSHPEAGIVGASIEDESGTRQRSAHAFPSPLSELDGAAQLGVLSRLIGVRAMALASSNVACVCDWVSGACFAVRREVFDEIGLLDEGYFLYFEETEFCFRAGRAGWSCWFVPAARVVHFEGSSTGIRDRSSRRPAYWFASRRRFFAKAHGLAGLAAADLLCALGRASLLLRRGLGLGGGDRSQPEPRRYVADLLVGDAKAIFRGDLRDLRVQNEGETGSPKLRSMS